MNCGPSGNVNDPQKQLFLNLDPPRHSESYYKNQKHSQEMGNPQISDIEHAGKDVGRKILVIRFIKSWES